MMKNLKMGKITFEIIFTVTNYLFYYSIFENKHLLLLINEIALFGFYFQYVLQFVLSTVKICIKNTLKL